MRRLFQLSIDVVEFKSERAKALKTDCQGLMLAN